MDAVVNTSMPSPRSLNSVQSEDHGLLLWCPIDANRTRIGYVFSKELQAKWGTTDGQGVTEEAVKEEARKAMVPFTLEFESVDWFTIYVRVLWGWSSVVRSSPVVVVVGSIGDRSTYGGAVYQGASHLGRVSGCRARAIVS
jgi:hypothetical protein